MAILIAEEKKQFNWLPLLILGVLLIFSVVGVYLLFFAEAPLIEYIAPSSQKRISDISAISSDQFVTTLSTTKKDLQGRVKQQGPSFLSGLGSVSGSSANPIRTNPFLSFK